MAVLNFTLSEEGVSTFRDALTCLNKFSDDVSLEARKDSLVLTTLNSSKSAYASFKFATNRFFSRYQYQGSRQFREKFYCTLYIRTLISLFRSRSSGDSLRDAEKQTLIDRCDIAIEDGEGVRSRFIARVAFRNGLTSVHRVPFEVAIPIHAKFSRQESPHHWKISSRTLRQLMEHFGPGIEYVDINTDGNHVNFTGFSEKTVSEDAVLKKPLQTSIAVEVDEFDEIDVEDKLHVVISVKDFRAIVQHAGGTGNDLSARYSLPSLPIQLSYSSDAFSCEFLVMTFGERGTNPAQITKKGNKASNVDKAMPRLEATSRRANETSAELYPPQESPGKHRYPPRMSHQLLPNPTPQRSAARASASRLSAFDLRPSQIPPRPTLRSQSLFVDDDGWVPPEDEADDEEDARLEWDYSVNYEPSAFHGSGAGEGQTEAPNCSKTQDQDHPDQEDASAIEQDSTYLEPTQKLSEVKGLALFPD